MYLKKTGKFCTHPMLRPTQWEQKRPASAEILACVTGCCESCPTCGCGSSQFPCTSLVKNKEMGMQFSTK